MNRKQKDLHCKEIGNGPNTVSESTVSNTELSKFFGPHQVPGRELSEFLSAYYWGAKKTHREKTCKQKFHGIVPEFWEGGFVYVFSLPKEWPEKNT